MPESTKIENPADIITTAEGRKKLLSKAWNGLGGVLNGLIHPFFLKIPIVSKNSYLVGLTETITGLVGAGLIKNDEIAGIMDGFSTVGASRLVQPISEMILSKVSGTSPKSQLVAKPTPQLNPHVNLIRSASSRMGAINVHGNRVYDSRYGRYR